MPDAVLNPIFIKKLQNIVVFYHHEALSAVKNDYIFVIYDF